MCRQFRRLDFDQIGFHVLDDSIADAVRQKIDNRRMDLGCRGECPAFLPTAVDNFGDLIGQLFVNAAIGLGFEFTLGDGRRSAMRARAFGDRKTSGQIGYLIDEFAVRVGDIEGLDQF